MIGPVSGLVSGQGVAFAQACEAMGSNAVVIDSAFVSVWSVLTFQLRLLAGFLRSSGPVYFTSSRSTSGFLARDLSVMLLSIVSRRPMVNHLHGNDFRAFRENAGFLLGALIDFCYRRVRISLAPTASLLLQYDRYPGMHTRAIANFFDDNIAGVPFTKASRGTLHVIFLSNLIHSKGFLVAAKAIEMLDREGMDVKLLLCGSAVGDHEMSQTRVEECVEELRGHSKIEVVGHIKDSAKYTRLAEAHIFVLPTTYPTEAAPISILEAFGAGCCVVTTDQGAIPELVQGFHARLVDAEPHAVASALRELEEISRDRQSWEHNRSLAIARFSADRYRSSVAAALSVANQITEARDHR